jgi:hypothetical protein
VGLGVIGKLFGLELPEVQMPEEFVLEDRSVLEGMADQTPTVPIGVFNVEGGGLHEGEITDTANRILANTQKMRAQMLRIQVAFHQMNVPQSYAIFTLDYEMRSAKVRAERQLVTRFHRSQSGGRNWQTPTAQNPYPIDIAYLREVALARNHIHTSTMIGSIAATLGPPASQTVMEGFVLPLTAQERAVSEQAAAERFVEQRAPIAQRQKILKREAGYAIYPHEASPTNPARAQTYHMQIEFVKDKLFKLQQATVKGTRESVLAARAAADEWHTFRNSIEPKWTYIALQAREQASQLATSALDPLAAWNKAYNAAIVEWQRVHPEVRGELAHAKTLIMPHQRWMNWSTGEPFTTPGSDGTNLDYLIAVEIGKPVASQQACLTARVQRALKAKQTGRTPLVYTNPC